MRMMKSMVLRVMWVMMVAIRMLVGMVKWWNDEAVLGVLNFDDRITDRWTFEIVESLSQLKIHFNTLSVKIVSFSAFLVQRLPSSELVLLVWRKRLNFVKMAKLVNLPILHPPKVYTSHNSSKHPQIIIDIHHILADKYYQDVLGHY